MSLSKEALKCQFSPLEERRWVRGLLKGLNIYHWYDNLCRRHLFMCSAENYPLATSCVRSFSTYSHTSSHGCHPPQLDGKLLEGRSRVLTYCRVWSSVSTVANNWLTLLAVYMQNELDSKLIIQAPFKWAFQEVQLNLAGSIQNQRQRWVSDLSDNNTRRCQPCAGSVLSHSLSGLLLLLAGVSSHPVELQAHRDPMQNPGKQSASFPRKPSPVGSASAIWTGSCATWNI